MGIIKPSKSEMSSPIVCVLKGKDGKDGVRIAVDYRYFNKYREGDAYPLADIPDSIHGPLVDENIFSVLYVSLCYGPYTLL